MDKDLVNGKIGSVGSYDLAWVGDEIVVSVNAQEGALRQKLELGVSADGVLDLIEKRFSNPIIKELCEAARKELKP